VQAIAKRPNICGAVTFHTYSGVHLRPPSSKPDDDLPAEDVWTFQKMGDKGTEMTGYPTSRFTTNSATIRRKSLPASSMTGCTNTAESSRGRLKSGRPSDRRESPTTKYIDWFREHPFSDDQKMLTWSDEKLGGKGYIDWYEFDHPPAWKKSNFGGWMDNMPFRNPPPDFLEAEVKPLGDWAIWQAGCSPKLELRDTVIDEVGNGFARIRFAVSQHWLATDQRFQDCDRS